MVCIVISLYNILLVNICIFVFDVFVCTSFDSWMLFIFDYIFFYFSYTSRTFVAIHSFSLNYSYLQIVAIMAWTLCPYTVCRPLSKILKFKFPEQCNGCAGHKVKYVGTKKRSGMQGHLLIDILSHRDEITRGGRFRDAMIQAVEKCLLTNV
jgi:hypothetical protein